MRKINNISLKIALGIIIKNEEKRIITTLSSCLELDVFYILDTATLNSNKSNYHFIYYLYKMFKMM
jgi:hypothetical protein